MAERYALAGSERDPLPGATVVGDADGGERILVTVVVRPRAHPPAEPASERMSREEYANAYGADPEDLRRVESFAREYGLHVGESSVPRSSVVLGGTVAQFGAAFGVTLKRYQTGVTAYRGHEGAITVPGALHGVVQAVLGLDNRPQARAHFQLRTAASAETPFTPLGVAALYDFPSDADGTGQHIGIIELGGGYSQSDLDAYFSGLGLSSPSVTAVSVDGATNNPGADTDADTEVMLDIEVAGAVAPHASIAVYFAPNTDQGFLDAVSTAVHDQANAPTVLSISWGGPESAWTAQAVQSFESSFQAAATIGVSICCASGDGGSSDGVDDGKPHADFPASSPYVLGCGGTTLEGSGTTIRSEVAWSDSGGGVSDLFAVPSWQSNAGVPPVAGTPGSKGRGVPDVCGDADPNTGYQIRVDGQDAVVGGTSAVAPLWAGLIALANQKLGKSVGFLNASLYSLPGYPGASAPLHDITSGSNGSYSAGRGWDPVTGLGSPDGSRLLQALGTS